MKHHIYPGLIDPPYNTIAEINKDMLKSGGWFIWRDLCLIENLPYIDNIGRRYARQRLSVNFRSSRHLKRKWKPLI